MSPEVEIIEGSAVVITRKESDDKQAHPDMDLGLVKKIIEIAENSDITGLAVEQNGLRIEVKRDKGIMIPAGMMQAPSAAYAPSAAPRDAVEEEGVTAIVSPMVGTFYHSPSPEAAPFVQVGDRVEAGKVVCIIEAMKLFNEIEAEVSGTVTKMLVENGHPVEYGQKLILIKKD